MFFAVDATVKTNLLSARLHVSAKPGNFCRILFVRSLSGLMKSLKFGLCINFRVRFSTEDGDKTSSSSSVVKSTVATKL